MTNLIFVDTVLNFSHYFERVWNLQLTNNNCWVLKVERIEEICVQSDIGYVS